MNDTELKEDKDCTFHVHLSFKILIIVEKHVDYQLLVPRDNFTIFACIDLRVYRLVKRL